MAALQPGISSKTSLRGRLNRGWSRLGPQAPEASRCLWSRCLALARRRGVTRWRVDAAFSSGVFSFSGENVFSFECGKGTEKEDGDVVLVGEHRFLKLDE